MPKRHVMTARRKAALRRAQLASARKRRKGKRIDRKISRVKKRQVRRTAKHHAQFRRRSYQNASGEIFTTKGGIAVYNKNVRSVNKTKGKVKKLKAKKRRL